VTNWELWSWKNSRDQMVGRLRSAAREHRRIYALGEQDEAFVNQQWEAPSYRQMATAEDALADAVAALSPPESLGVDESEAGS
jgi:hypothetical protein